MKRRATRLHACAPLPLTYTANTVSEDTCSFGHYWKDIANQKAKEIASEINRGVRDAPKVISVLDARRACAESTDIANQSWQCKARFPSIGNATQRNAMQALT